MKGKLYVVATPIGNLQDITLRALETLKNVDYIACEDTRVAKKLLNHFGITGKTLIPYHDHNEETQSEKLLEILKEKDVALISDAGTPTISDPGYRLVKKASERGIQAIPIPGVSAAIAALSVSGLPTDRFMFIGFLPKTEGKKEKELENIKKVGITTILYESPNRILKTLQTIEKVMPDADVVVAKELTKLHEEFIRGKPKDVKEFFEKNKDKLKGEFVIIVKPNDNEEVSEESLEEEIKKLKEQGLSTKEISKVLAQKYGLSKKEVYKKVLSV